MPDASTIFERVTAPITEKGTSESVVIEAGLDPELIEDVMIRLSQWTLGTRINTTLAIGLGVVAACIALDEARDGHDESE